MKLVFRVLDDHENTVIDQMAVVFKLGGNAEDDRQQIAAAALIVEKFVGGRLGVTARHIEELKAKALGSGAVS